MTWKREFGANSLMGIGQCRLWALGAVQRESRKPPIRNCKLAVCDFLQHPRFWRMSGINELADRKGSIFANRPSMEEGEGVCDFFEIEQVARGHGVSGKWPEKSGFGAESMGSVCDFFRRREGAAGSMRGVIELRGSSLDWFLRPSSYMLDGTAVS